MFWRLPVGELFYDEERPSDLDLILKWYERFCPERSVHINTGIQIAGENDHSLTVTPYKNVKSIISSVQQSQIDCSVYTCKVSGRDKGPKYEWPCDYIDAWSHSAVFDSDILEHNGRMKDDLATALRIRRVKWARFDMVDLKKWREMGREEAYIGTMNAIKMRAREQ